MNKYLQCGDFKVVHPMKYCGTIKEKDVERVMKSDQWYMQEKYDGAFFQLMKNDEGKIGLFSRTISRKNGEYVNKIDNVPWLEVWMQDSRIPNNTTIVGEIYIPGGHSNDVTKIMGCLPQKAIQRQKETKVQYMVFDCILYDGLDLCNIPFSHRFEDYIEGKMKDVFFNDGEAHPQVKIVNTKHIALGQGGDYSNALKEIFGHGGEGVVFKHKDSLYRPGKRTTSTQMFKYKEHIDSIDLIIMDTLDPEKVYTGKELDTWQYWEGDVPVTKPWYYKWKNALRLGAYNDEGKIVEVCRVASGLTDNIRAELAINPNDYVGIVCQISCMSVNKEDLTVRHPVFECFRADKNPEDCKINEIFV